jgi:hypothetical protein
MRSSLYVALSLAPLAVACASTHASDPDPALMMERWTAYMTPSAGHAHLAPRVGQWSMTVRMFSAPGAPAEESRGTSTVEWTMDGRYLRDTTAGEFAGQSFQGLGFTGYDNLKKAYVSTWMDNFGTGILVSEGRYDESTRTFHYRGSGPEFLFANAFVPTRATERWIDGDHFVMQAFAPGADGKEFMNMEIEYARLR